MSPLEVLAVPGVLDGVEAPDVGVAVVALLVSDEAGAAVESELLFDVGGLSASAPAAPFLA